MFFPNVNSQNANSQNINFPKCQLPKCQFLNFAYFNLFHKGGETKEKDIEKRGRIRNRRKVGEKNEAKPHPPIRVAHQGNCMHWLSWRW